MKAKYLLSICAAALFSLTACVGDLDVKPLDPQVQTGEKAYSTPEAFDQGLAKIYSSWAMSGQEGEGSSDISGLDPGNAQLLRSWWNLQEISTDECKNSWEGDPWPKEINNMAWTNVQNESIEAVYQRLMLVVAFCNEYITQAKATSVISGDKKTTVIAEARFVRAWSYQILMDLYARPPFITEENYSTQPSQLTRSGLFDWVETELKAIRSDLPAARAGEYGHADQGAIDFLLARMYLNAEVYKGTPMYNECVDACKSVIAGGYSLATTYQELFLADNDKTSAKNEIILPIIFDGVKTKTWGGMTYLLCSSRGSATVNPVTDGVSSGWDGNRATGAFTKQFACFDENNRASDLVIDTRGIFYSGNTEETIGVSPLASFKTHGWQVLKFKNVYKDGTRPADEQFPETDFPMFRLADAYLMYGEAIARGATNGNRTTAIGYINDLRQRGGLANLAEVDLTLDNILKERTHELYWEGVRRTDLIRFGKFTTADYLWEWKGGVVTGVAVGDHLKVYPIPMTDVTANANLEPTPGY
jgi:hypothetical protein